MNHLLSKALFLFSTFLLITGCTTTKGKDSYRSSDRYGDPTQRETAIQPGTKINLNQDNIFDFVEIPFPYLPYSDEEEIYPEWYHAFRINASLEIRCTGYGYQEYKETSETEYHVKEVTFSGTLRASKLTDEQFATGMYSVITMTDRSSNVVDDQYSFSYKRPVVERIETEIVICDGYAMATEIFYNAKIIHDNYEYFLERGIGVVFYKMDSEIEERDSLILFSIAEGCIYLFYENLRFEIEYITFNSDYSIKSKRPMTINLNSVSDRQLFVPRNEIYTVNVVNVTGDIYVPTNVLPW